MVIGKPFNTTPKRRKTKPGRPDNLKRFPVPDPGAWEGFEVDFLAQRLAAIQTAPARFRFWDPIAKAASARLTALGVKPADAHVALSKWVGAIRIRLDEIEAGTADD
jgi:hypothetical protein